MNQDSLRVPPKLPRIVLGRCEKCGYEHRMLAGAQAYHSACGGRMLPVVAPPPGKGKPMANMFGYGTPKQAVYEAVEQVREEYDLTPLALVRLLAELAAYYAEAAIDDVGYGE